MDEPDNAPAQIAGYLMARIQKLEAENEILQTALAAANSLLAEWEDDFTERRESADAYFSVRATIDETLAHRARS